MKELAARPHGPTFSIAELCAVIALVALVCKWPAAAGFAIPAIGFRLSTRLVGVAPARVALIIVCLYVPTMVGFFLDCAHCRGVWLTLWSVVPGGGVAVLVNSLFRVNAYRDVTMFAVAAISTLGLLVLFARLSAKGTIPLVLSAIVCLVGSGIESMIFSAMIRM